MNEDRALEQQFLDRAKALTNVAEVFRCLQVTMLICGTIAIGGLIATCLLGGVLALVYKRKTVKTAPT